MTLGTTKVTIGTGDIISLRAFTTPTNSTDNLKWKSGKPKIAGVNKYGIVTGLSEGTSKITVTTSSGKKASCIVSVKKYLTNKEAKTLLSSGTVADEDIETAVQKYSLSENDVKDLISANMISESTIKKWIKDGTISEKKIAEIVKNNSLTEEDVIRLIEEHTGSDKESWKDGDTLKMIGESLPSTERMSITAIDIKKYHVDNPPKDRTPYKYVLTIDGTIGKEDYESACFGIVFSSSKGNGIDLRGYHFGFKGLSSKMCKFF